MRPVYADGSWMCPHDADMVARCFGFENAAEMNRLGAIAEKKRSDWAEWIALRAIAESMR